MYTHSCLYECIHMCMCVGSVDPISFPFSCLPPYFSTAWSVGEHGSVRSFREKNTNDGAAINAGFMVFQPEIFCYLKDDTTILETEPLERLAEESQLMSYQHSGFWQCMDTTREKDILERLWASGQAPWKVWGD